MSRSPREQRLIPPRNRPLLVIIALHALLLGCGENPEQPRMASEEAVRSGGSTTTGGQVPEIPESVNLAGAAIAEAGIQIWKVQPVDLEHLLVLSGTIGHDENRLVHVASNVRGRIASIPVDLGQWVRKEDPLAWIESIDLSHAWDDYIKGLTDLKVSQQGYDRARALLDAKAISTGEFQTREAAYLSKRIEVQTLERSLRLYGEPEAEIASVRASVRMDGPPLSLESPHRTAVRSPFAGRVIDRSVTPGSLVEALQPLVTVANLSTVWVFLQAYEKDLALLKEGLPVTIRTDAYPQESFHGRVDFVSSVVDETTRTTRVRASVPNPAEKLRPGMFVRASVEVPKPEEEAHKVLAVPESALQTLEGRTTVFVETEPGHFLRIAVETGHTFEGFTEVLSGLKAGDAVVTEGSFVLKGEFARATLVEEE